MQSCKQMMGMHPPKSCTPSDLFVKWVCVAVIQLTSVKSDTTSECCSVCGELQLRHLPSWSKFIITVLAPDEVWILDCLIAGC